MEERLLFLDELPGKELQGKMIRRDYREYPTLAYWKMEAVYFVLRAGLLFG